MKKLTSQLGFTMIELLIVITILGILAVAVLSAINPIEQINRGRDTGSQSDAEQLLSAIDRFNAFQGYFPWQADADDLDTSIMVSGTGEDAVRTNDEDEGLPIPVTATLFSANVGTELSPVYCSVFSRLSNGDDDILTGCNGAQEVKDSFVNRMLDTGTRTLYVYNSGRAGGSTYVCFIPQSGAFETQARERCANDLEATPLSIGAGLPDDVGAAARAFICGGEDGATTIPMSCLP